MNNFMEGEYANSLYSFECRIFSVAEMSYPHEIKFVLSLISPELKVLFPIIS